MNEKLVIEGGAPLHGELLISGSKNAALPILFSSLLTPETCVIERTPRLKDIETTLELLTHLGASHHYENGKLEIETSKLQSNEAPYELVRAMRASILALGPLLARLGEARVALPGGCSIGARPVNFHLSALKKLGAEIDIVNGFIEAKAKKLRGTTIQFRRKTVTGTENIIMAACLAEGTTVLENAAQEPEIVDLVLHLRKMGAKISGEGTKTITIEGVSKLNGAKHEVCADRIEAGTFLCVVMAAGGEIRLRGIPVEMMLPILQKVEQTGVTLRVEAGAIHLKSTGRLQPVDITTQPFPGFPTDMQAQWMAAMCFADGDSRVTEKVFENRFMHVAELRRMGAVILEESPYVCLIKGNAHPILGAPVVATDLRASAGLVVAALRAKGVTEMSQIYHLDRGYEDFDQKLRNLGAHVRRIG